MTRWMKGYRSVTGKLHNQGATRSVDWNLPQECPIAICLNGDSYAVMLATPLDIEDFVIGFCLSEGLVTSPDKIFSIRIKEKKEGIEVDLQLDEQALERVHLMNRRRTLAGSSGCGICGLTSLSHVLDMASPIKSNIKIPIEAILKVRETFENTMPLHKACFSVHGAVFANCNGDILMTREDVGRHNALDKLIGGMALQKLDMENGFILMTSRFAYELVQKCARVKIPIVISISAPTSMAIDMAEKAGITLGAFSGKNGLMIFANEGRLDRTFKDKGPL